MVKCILLFIKSLLLNRHSNPSHSKYMTRYPDQQASLQAQTSPESHNRMTRYNPLVRIKTSEQAGGRCEERRARQRFREVEQAIMQAGGVTEFGSLKNVRLIRTINGVQQMQVMDMRPALAGAPTRAFYVRDGDVIYVPQSAF